MSKNSLAITILALISSSATAQNIDVGAAATGALVTVLVRGVIAFCLFKLITLNLTSKGLDTPVKSGRWIGAWLMAVSILNHPSLHKSDIDIYVGSAIMAIVWFVIGFVVGYVWRKLKPFKTVATTESTSAIGFFAKNRLNIFLALLVLALAVGMYLVRSNEGTLGFSSKQSIQKNTQMTPSKADGYKCLLRWNGVSFDKAEELPSGYSTKYVMRNMSPEDWMRKEKMFDLLRDADKRQDTALAQSLANSIRNEFVLATAQFPSGLSDSLRDAIISENRSAINKLCIQLPPGFHLE